MSDSDLVGTTEAAQMLGVTRQRVNQMVREGKITGVRVGNAWAFERMVIFKALLQRNFPRDEEEQR
jgi:excisionase family DNA binding protein